MPPCSSAAAGKAEEIPEMPAHAQPAGDTCLDKVPLHAAVSCMLLHAALLARCQPLPVSESYDPSRARWFCCRKEAAHSWSPSTSASTHWVWLDTPANAAMLFRACGGAQQQLAGAVRPRACAQRGRRPMREAAAQRARVSDEPDSMGASPAQRSTAVPTLGSSSAHAHHPLPRRPRTVCRRALRLYSRPTRRPEAHQSLDRPYTRCTYVSTSSWL